MIKPNIFLQLPKDNSLYGKFDSGLKKYSKLHPDQLVFCIHSPLGMDTSYEYDGAILLSPNYKITFFGIEGNRSAFDNYVDDIFDDISALSKKYNYQKFIGRLREWKDRVVTRIDVGVNDEIEIERYISGDNNIADNADWRLVKYLISLFTGSINDLNEDALADVDNLLDEIKRKIVLFDADQTRFLFNNYAVKSFISVQGLSGTGKTELLLHKLRDIYSQAEKLDNFKVFFTCHNIALANELRTRIPDFFNKMKVTRQIEWEKELWVAHAWGAQKNPNTGLYSYICHYYNLPFQRYSTNVNYDVIYSKIKNALDRISKKEFSYCFEYILIDESQDFPEVFFEVCKKITRKKVYTAGDVFQNIFYQMPKKPKGVDIVLNRCYRTDPRTLMFAHSLGLGLQEERKYNWFEKEDWELFGYNVEKEPRTSTLTLKRLPLSRFEGNEPAKSVVIESGTDVLNICKILNRLKEEYPNVRAGDVSIIMIDDDKDIYKYIDVLTIRINEIVGWKVIRGYEVKHTDPDMLYLTNTNNVKGLEFPFVICITGKILNEHYYRNKIYTMLTRSFLVTYLIVKDKSQIDWLKVMYSEISQNGVIKDIKIPTDEEKKVISRALISQSEVRLESWEDFMGNIFMEMGIKDPAVVKRVKETILSLKIEKFNEEKIKRFINSTIEFL